MDLTMLLRLSVAWSVLFICSEFGVHGATQSPLTILKQWNLLSYTFEYDNPPNDKNYYIPENIVATGIAMTYDRIFVATPRLFSGVPATLSSVPLTEFGNSPTLQPYPDWTFHTVSKGTYNCSDLGLVSVYRLRTDSCNRLWVLDAGVSTSLENFQVTCPPKILIFDLNTNQVVRRIDFPRQVRRGESLFTNLIIDETTSRRENNCDDVFVYISDTVEPAIVVYDSGRDLTWRLTHPSMYPDPDFAQSEIRGDRFVLMDGIVGIAYDEKAGVVYYQPLATDRVFSVTKQVLRAGPIPITQVLSVNLVGRKSSQGVGLALSPVDGSIIFSPLSETALATYNPQSNQQSILAHDMENLQFVADMTFSRFDEGALYMVSSKFQRYFLKNIDSNEVNVRIMRIQLNSPTTGENINRPTYFPFSLSRQIKVQVPLRKPNYSNEFFSGIRQPYQFEPVGIVNRGTNNPFSVLNSREQFPGKAAFSILGSSPFPHINPNFINFNGLRLAKSITNSTIIHQ